MAYIINKNDLYLTVKAINRLPDAYDNRSNGVYKSLLDTEMEILRDKAVSFQLNREKED